MNDFIESLRLGWGLLASLDPNLLAIVRLSLEIALGALAIGAALGIPAGAALAIYRVPGRGLLILMANAFMGLPPVVAGLAAYLLLSQSGPFGKAGLLFTPAAMVIVQSILVFPIIVAIVHRGTEGAWVSFGDAFQVSGAARFRTIPHLLAIARGQMLTALLAGFGRAISEVGGIMIVGGNIAGETRTMTTAIMLETSKGNLPLALALGIILIALTVLANALAFSCMAGKAKDA